ncbi:MAG: sigma 54-interacting transcriptional regulator [Deltaproteobacteria bacterium]|nr:sigma 54-interacting transcriptional regulator [Deltaproteobacteria bacterium]
MPLIAFLAPDEEMLTAAKATLAEAHSDVLVDKGLLSAGVRKARELVREGVEIVIARGGTAVAINKAQLGLTVVEVPITGFEMIRALGEAMHYGRRIAVVAFPSMIMGIDCLGPILDINLTYYSIESEFKVESRVLQAIQEGADVIIGGVITVEASSKHHLPCVLIRSGAEGIIQATLEAKRIAEARRIEKVKSTLFQTVLDYAYEGIISTDQNNRVVIFNPVAEKITKVDGKRAIGRNVQDAFPQLELGRLLQTGRDELGQIIDVGSTQILCNKVPIQVHGAPIGAVATFQDIGKIQQWEANIRKKIYAEEHTAVFTFADVIGSSRQMRNSVAIAEQFAAADASVLISGETGTGKEVFAQSIHNASGRGQKPFVAINCAALPAQILESELFGYVGGAFTGADKKGKPGLLEIAHGGTLFLDEIAEMDYSLQSKLLRVIQEKKVMRLGSDRILPVDIRIIAATNKNLKQLVTSNRFRADLYYRLNVLRLHLPPLRERSEDVELCAKTFLERHATLLCRRMRLSKPAIQAFIRHSWPGNVRELQNTIERIVAICKHETVQADMVFQMMREDELNEPLTINAGVPWTETIRQALVTARGRHTEAAKILGISRSTLWRRMKSLGLYSTHR